MTPVYQFFPKFRRHILSLAVLAVITSTLLAASLAWLAFENLPQLGNLNLVITVAAALICQIICALWIVKKATEPLKIITQALAHVSKDAVSTPPPDISPRRYQKNGLQTTVKTIYELAIGSRAPVQEAPLGTPGAEQILAGLPCGVIAMSAGKIIYSNQVAPVAASPDGQQSLKLIFEKGDTFEDWLRDCQENKVRANRTWLRIADNLPDQNPRYFDIAAYYQKENPGGIDVILAAFDRTAAYSPDEEDMSFIAMAAHELRGPITVIRGYLDELRQEEQAASPERRELLDRLQVSSQRLSGYVNNILNISRYDRQQFKIHLDQESLADIFNEIAPDLTLRATTQNRRLSLNLPADLPPVAADRATLEEVITNLVDNAIKYSYDGGEVVIGAQVKEDVVEITVTDSGIGIPSSVLGNLFTRFYRSHRSRQQVGGTGLGLYICKAIIEAHGGSIWVRSAEGQGSTFGFSLPVYQEAAFASSAQTGDNKEIQQRSEGWIKNHSMYRR